MSYAEKRGDDLTGKWYGEVRHPRNGRFRRRFITKDKADAYETHIKAFGEEPDWAREDDGGETIGRTFKDVALELKRVGGPDGVWARGKDKSILQRLEWVYESTKIGRTLIADVSYTLVEQELVEPLKCRPGQQEGDKLSPATVNRYLTAVSAVLSYAVKKHTKDDPYITAAPELPWQKVPRKKRHTYSHVQQAAVTKVLHEAGHHVEAFLVDMLAQGGLRAGELLGVRPEQIVDDFIELDDPEGIKNEETRSVYIGTENAMRLRTFVVHGHMPTYHQLYTRLRAALKTCGYTMPRPLHSMRHTAATRTLEVELDVQVAQQLLGHRSINTTLGYRHVPKEVLRERAQKVSPHRGKEGDNTWVIDFAAIKKA